MREKLLLGIAMTTFCALLLTGCGHQHVFSDATCDTPATCAEDGATQGEALGHDFVEATCEAPATCSRCNATQGEALGHDFMEATCEAPATCSRCNATQGEALEHDFAPATTEAPKTCKACGITEGDKVSVKIIDTTIKTGNEYIYIIDEDRFLRENGWDFTVCDANNKVIKKFVPNLPDYMTDTVTGGYIVAMGDTSNGVKIIVYNRDGEELYSNVITKADYSEVPDFIEDWTSAKAVAKDEIDIYNVNSGHIICTILPEYGDMLPTMEGVVVNIDDNEPQPAKPVIDGVQIWEYNDIIGAFLANFVDDDEWGFVYPDGKETIRFRDVCSYNKAGYALVSKDRKTYSIIDIEQNIICEDFIEGKSSSLSLDERYLKVTKQDNTIAYVLIE